MLSPDPIRAFWKCNGNALLNGQSAASTYGLWSYYGNQGNTVNNTQFRVSAIGSGDIGDHALQMGFEYEQRRDGYYELNPIGLWTLARLTTNSHIKEIDTPTAQSPTLAPTTM